MLCFLKVTFKEMADEHPDADAGDVVFVLKQQAPTESLSRAESGALGAGVLWAERVPHASLCGLKHQANLK